MKAHTAALGTSLVAVSLLLAGCDKDSAADALSSGKAHLAKHESKAAIIQFKNVLQKTPDSGEARFLLGKSMLQDGDAVSAAVEFRKALDSGYPASQAVPQLARALVATQEHNKLIDQYGATTLDDKEALADLKVSVATAYLARQNSQKASGALREALAAVPDHPAALIFEARMKATERKFDEALSIVDKVLGAAPGNAEAWQVKGDILHQGRSDAAGALAAYDKALAADPSYLPARVSAITVLFGQQDLEKAKPHFEELRKKLPNHPQTNYFAAQFAYAAKDYKKAKELIQQALRVLPDNPKVLSFAGLVELGDQSFAQAENYFAKALQLYPQLAGTRWLLAQTYLRSGQSAKALEALQPLLAESKPGQRTVVAAAEAYLQAGDVGKAQEYFERAVKLDPADTKSRTALALTHANAANADSVFSELETIAAADNNIYADQVLVAAHLRRQEYDKAMKVIDSIAKKQPDKPLAENLRGQVFLLQKNVAQARSSFERALKLDPAFIPAAAALASLDLADKRGDAARKRFEGVLAADPKSVSAHLALANLKVHAGGSVEEVATNLSNAVTANPTSLAARLALVNHYLASKRPKPALNAAQEAVATLPQNPELLDILARAQQAAGESNQAINTLNRLASMQPASPQPHLRLAGVYLAVNKPDAAKQSLRQALAVTPNLLEAQNVLVKLELDAHRPEDALSIARTVQKQRPREAVGFLMEGSIESSRKNQPAAVEVYRTALKKLDSVDLAIKLHETLRASGKAQEAEQLAATWIKGHPNDAGFCFYLGQAFLDAGDYVASENYFQQSLRLVPENPLVLNNVAWVTAKLNKPGAVAYAQKANTLWPNQPVVLDTLAMALLADNQVAKAIDTQKQALALAPGNHVLRLNLAKMYLRAGDKSAARAELDVLVKLDGKVEAQAEANRLLKTL